MSMAFQALTFASDAALVSDFRRLQTLAIGGSAETCGELCSWFNKVARADALDLSDVADTINAEASRFLTRFK